MGHLKVKNIYNPSLLKFCVLIMLSNCVVAQDISHVHIDKSSDLRFDAILEQALLRAPAYREIAARHEQAQSQEDIGRSWVAGRPSAQLDYIDDRSLSNLGEKELTYGLALPLWRPGEKQDMQALGRQYSQNTQDWQRNFTLTIAGAVRASLAELHRAEALQALEQQATEDARALVSTVETLFAAGEVAQIDVMQARTLLLTQQRNELDADALRVDAERNYHTLTGLAVAPTPPHSEELANAGEISPEHPYLRLLQSNIDLQEANINKEQTAAKGNPTLTLGSRRQKADAYADYSNALAISLSIPFGGKSFVSAAANEARRAKVDAQVQYHTALRELNMQLHEVEHRLFTVARALPLSREQAALSQRQWDMARNAFELGETDMSRVVIAMQQARASAKELETLTMQNQRLILEFNQIIGVLP